MELARLPSLVLWACAWKHIDLDTRVDMHHLIHMYMYLYHITLYLYHMTLYLHHLIQCTCIT